MTEEEVPSWLKYEEERQVSASQVTSKQCTFR